MAPAGIFATELLDEGVRWLSTRFAVRQGPHLRERSGYLAGTDAQRLADLHWALSEPSVKAIVCARGGYGATRLLPLLDFEAIARANKWLVGFSDVTALHAQWARASVRSIHAPMATKLPSSPEASQRAWLDVTRSGTNLHFEGLSTIVAGRASGRLLGGNLAVLTALVGTPYMPDLRGSVLLLEDVTEKPYRVDRMLTTLRQSGALDGISAIALGAFTECDAGPDGTSVESVLVERLADLRVPIVAGLPVGHIDDNRALVLGEDVEIDATAGTLAPC